MATGIYSWITAFSSELKVTAFGNEIKIANPMFVCGRRDIPEHLLYNIRFTAKLCGYFLHDRNLQGLFQLADGFQRKILIAFQQA